MDGEPLSAERFADAYDEVKPYLALVDQDQPAALSFFEVLTAMAFAVFADAPVDVAVIEVGVGGTWDCTNVADGAVAVVTPISIDHVRYLGNTVQSIAADKAGIIKPGAVAVLAQQPLDAAEVLLRRAAEVGATVAREGLEFGVTSRELAVGGQLIGVRGLLGQLRRPVPAAVRRPSGQQRRLRPGRGRGVRRGLADRGAGRRRGRAGGARRRPGPLGVRDDVVTGAARGGPPQPGGGGGRGPQPGRDGRDRGRADRGVRAQRAGRDPRGQRGQGRVRDTGRARAGRVRAGGDGQLLAQVRRPGQAGRAGDRGVRARTGSAPWRGSTTRSSSRWAWPTRSTRARPEGGPPGTVLVLITGSVITAGDARLLLTHAPSGEPAPGPAGSGRQDRPDA